MLRGYFEESYVIGSESLFSVLNTLQVEEYETYFENLTIAYTNEPVTANCTIIKQDIFLNLTSQQMLIIGYEIIWMAQHDRSSSTTARRILQSDDINTTVPDELIDNYINYINEEESIEDIKVFLNSMFVIVDEVQLTQLNSYEVITKDSN